MDHGKVQFDGTPVEVFRHYKELEKMGLAAPQVTYLMHSLREKGWDVNVDAITVAQAKQEIMRVWKKH